jgi:hypothetical protein
MAWSEQQLDQLTRLKRLKFLKGRRDVNLLKVCREDMSIAGRMYYVNHVCQAGTAICHGDRGEMSSRLQFMVQGLHGCSCGTSAGSCVGCIVCMVAGRNNLFTYGLTLMHEC